MISTKIGDLEYRITRSDSPTKTADGFFLMLAFLVVGLLEALTYPIWRPIYWLIKRR